MVDWSPADIVPARLRNPKYLWGLVAPGFLLLVALIIVLFIIVRKVSKHKNYDKLLEDTYGISLIPSNKARTLEDDQATEDHQDPEDQV